MTKHFPKPPFKAQPQSIPGRSDKMDPKPDYGETTYRGSNKLKDKKAIITGFGRRGHERFRFSALWRNGTMRRMVPCQPKKSQRCRLSHTDRIQLIVQDLLE
jgi:hypothetical protein